MRMRPGIFALAIATAIAAIGCIMWPLPGTKEAQQWVQGHDFHKAAFTMNGDRLSIRNDDKEGWHAATVTLDTSHGYFREKAGDVEPGEVKTLPLGRFVDQTGKPPDQSVEVKSVWVHYTYADGRVADELAFPATTFGLKPVTPSGGS